MEERRQILCAEEFQIIYTDALLSGRRSTSPHSSFQRGRYGNRRGRSNCTLDADRWSRSDQHPQWCHVDNTYLSHSGMRTALWLWDLPPSNPYPRLTIRQTMGKGHSTKRMTSTPQSCQDRQKQRKSEKHAAKRSLRRLVNICDVVPWRGSRNTKWH